MITGKEKSKIRTVSWKFEQDLEDSLDLAESWGWGTLDDRTCEQRHEKWERTQCPWDQ